MTTNGRAWVLAAVGLSGALSTAFHPSRLWRESSVPELAEGRVEPALEPVGSGLGGTVTEVYVKQGDRIRAGDLMVRFDDSAVRARLRNW